MVRVTDNAQPLDNTEETQGGVRVTRTTLADGRELMYFDDDSAYVSGEKTRQLHDSRELPAARTVSEMRRDPLTGQWLSLIHI